MLHPPLSPDILAAKTQPQLQNLLWRLWATIHERDFTGRTEGQKVQGVRAAAIGPGAALRAEWRGEPSKLVIFCPSCEKSRRASPPAVSTEAARDGAYAETEGRHGSLCKRSAAGQPRDLGNR